MALRLLIGQLRGADPGRVPRSDGGLPANDDHLFRPLRRHDLRRRLRDPPTVLQATQDGPGVRVAQLKSPPVKNFVVKSYYLVDDLIMIIIFDLKCYSRIC